MSTLAGKVNGDEEMVKFLNAENAEAEDSQSLDGRFAVGKYLGSGSFSVVKLATHTATQKPVALKMMSKKKIQELGTQEKVRREMENLRRCAAHFHIVRLYDVVHTPDDICLVTDCASGGEIHDYITSQKTQMLSPTEARSFFQQIMSAVEYMHYKRVAHRDLKLENILLDKNLNIKIADLGFSHEIRPGEFMHTSLGSPHYVAPEIISGNPYLGQEVDVWACGVILYALLCGTYPFLEESIKDQYAKIKSGLYTIPSHVCKEAQTLIQGILQVDTKERMGVAGIRQNTWFKEDLPLCLQRTPEMIEKEERTLLDSDVVDQIVQLYENENITRELVVEAVSDKHENGFDKTPSKMRELCCAYQLFLDEKHDDRRVEEKRRRNWCSRAWQAVCSMTVASIVLLLLTVNSGH